jgi:hypothetical protein
MRANIRSLFRILMICLRSFLWILTWLNETWCSGEMLEICMWSAAVFKNCRSGCCFQSVDRTFSCLFEDSRELLVRGHSRANPAHHPLLSWSFTYSLTNVHINVHILIHILVDIIQKIST